MTVLIAAPAVFVPWASSEPWWVDIGLVAVLLVAVVAVVVDLTSERIPDRVVLTSLVPTTLVLVVHAVADGGDVGSAVAGVLLGAVAFAAPLLIVHLAVPHALGFGDVKLAAALGGALGLVDWRVSVAALCIASGMTAAVALVRRRPTVPFAPGLVVGAALVLLLPTLEGSLPWR